MKSGQFAMIPARALDDRRMTNAAKNVLLNISRYAGKSRRSFPSLSTVAEHMEITKQAVHKQVQLLVEWGYLNVERRERRNGATSSNAYLIVYDADLPSEFDRGEPGIEDDESVNARLTPKLTGGSPHEVDGSSLKRPPETESPHPPKGEGELFQGESEEQTLKRLNPDVDTEFEKNFWPRWPAREGSDPRKPALHAYTRARRAHTMEAIMAGLSRDLETWTATGAIGTRMIPMAQTWLNQERWIGKHGAAQPRTELTPGAARDIRSYSQLNAVLTQHGLPEGKPGRREFCIRNGINLMLLQG